jgi:hypothetical protein
VAAQAYAEIMLHFCPEIASCKVGIVMTHATESGFDGLAN